MGDNQSFEYTYSAPEQEEIKRIREKYLPKDKSLSKLEQLRLLDKKAEQPGHIWALSLGISGTLIFGTGMSLCLVMAKFVLGIVLGVIGMAVLALAYPVYRKVTKLQREKLSHEILRLSEELMK